MANRRHIPALDGLRGIAVLLVLWAHVPTGSLGTTLETAKLFVKPGYMGVDVFFVLSGFLITRILLADREAGVPLSWFWARRFLRIFPIYYLLLAVLWFVERGREWPWCAGYLSNFYFIFHGDLASESSSLRHTWSLAIEEHYYLVWPLVVYALRGRRKLVLGAGLLLVLALASALVALFLDQTPELIFARRWIHESSTVRAVSLLLGSLMAVYEDRVRELAGSSAHVLLLAVVAAGGFTAGWVYQPPLWPLWMMSGYALFSAGLLLFSVGPPSRASGASGGHKPALHARVLESASLRYVGRISYGLYLLHLPIYHAFGMHMRQGAQPVSPSRAALAALVAFGAASVSYYAIERPILRLQDRFRPRSQPT